MEILSALAMAGAIISALAGLFYFIRKGTYTAAKETIDILKAQVDALNARDAEREAKIAELSARLDKAEERNLTLTELVTNAAKVDRLIEMYDEYVENAKVERHDIKNLIAANHSYLELILSDIHKN